MLFYRNILSQNYIHQPTMVLYHNILSQTCCSPTYHAVLSYHFATKFAQQPTMLFYRNILVQNLFTYLPCSFILPFCHNIFSPTFHAVLA